MNPSRFALLLSAGLLLPQLPAHAAVLTVGPDGTHGSIQAALDTAGSIPEDHYIRIRYGTWSEHLAFVMDGNRSVSVTGGWNDDFTLRSEDPGATVVDGGGSGVPLRAIALEGEASFSNLTLRGGISTVGGGGATLRAAETGVITLRQCVVHGNMTSGSDVASAGGISVTVGDDGFASVIDCHVHGNRAAPPTGMAAGGGIRVEAFGRGGARVRDNLVEANIAESSENGAHGAGIFGLCSDDADIVIEGNRINLNQAYGAAAATDGHGLRLAAEDAMPDACFILARRNILTRNGSSASAGSEGFQARVDVRGWSSVELGDSEISGGSSDGGLRIDALEQAHLRIANLTIAGNAGTGISLLREADADVRLHNTLIYGNGNDALPTEASAASHNLVAVDPHFVAPGNYRLRATSPARDAGTNDLPGFFWGTDADGGSRLVGPAVDIGAYEFGSFRVFADGFED